MSGDVMPRCSARVARGSGGWRNQAIGGCAHPATVTRDGVDYCGQHDPERVKARREKSNAVARAKYEERGAALNVDRARVLVAEAAIAYVDAKESGVAVRHALRTAVAAFHEADRKHWAACVALADAEAGK